MQKKSNKPKIYVIRVFNDVITYTHIHIHTHVRTHARTHTKYIIDYKFAGKGKLKRQYLIDFIKISSMCKNLLTFLF